MRESGLVRRFCFLGAIYPESETHRANLASINLLDCAGCHHRTITSVLGRRDAIAAGPLGHGGGHRRLVRCNTSLDGASVCRSFRNLNTKRVRRNLHAAVRWAHTNCIGTSSAAAPIKRSFSTSAYLKMYSPCDGPGLVDAKKFLLSRRSGRGVFGFVHVGRAIAQRLVKASAIGKRCDEWEHGQPA